MRVELPVLPYRPYQVALRRYIDEGGKRAVFVMHRRAGKDIACWQIMVEQAIQHVGTYFYCLPEFAHCRRVIFDGMTNEGKRIVDLAPAPLVKSRNESEMKLEFINGSIIRLVGADQYDRLVGTNPRGIVFSEYSLTNPMAWQLLRPILAANGGWAIFQGTPRGKNHLHSILKQAKEEPKWFYQVSPVTDTNAISQEALDEEKRQMVPDLYAQEYLCSFDASAIGAYYSEEMRAVREQGRLCKIPFDPNIPVDTAWDLGINDTMVIVCVQQVAQEVRMFKVIANNSKPLSYYAEELKALNCRFGTHYLPHDAGSRQLSTGKTIADQLRQLLPNHGNIVVVPRQEVYAGIQKVRSLFARFWIDEREETFIEALSQYCKEYDEEKKTFADRPLHDWCFTGDTKVLTRYGTHRIMDLPLTGSVLTPCGWKPYHSPRITRRNARLVEVAFKDGITVRCTPDHMFKTEEGWKSAESLTKGMLIQSSLTPSRSILMAASTVYGRVMSITHEVARSFIVMFGKWLSGLFQMDVTSITKIETQPTTASLILNASQQEIILPSLTPQLEQAQYQPSPEKEPPSGTSLRKADSGIDVMPFAVRAGRSGSGKIENVSAERCSKASSVLGVLRKSIARLTARPLRIESVSPVDYQEDVWCITVPGEEAFSLENGAVVHNCSHYADAVRTYCMGANTSTQKPPQSKPRNIPTFLKRAGVR